MTHKRIEHNNIIIMFTEDTLFWDTVSLKLTLRITQDSDDGNYTETWITFFF